MRAGKRLFQRGEQAGLAGLLVFGLKLVQHLLQQRAGPVLVEQLVGRGIIRGLQIVALLGPRQVQREDLTASAPFLRAELFPFVGQEVVHRGQQEGAEPAFLAVGVAHPTMLQKACEELLSQILRIGGGEVPPAHVGVKGIPVGLA